MAVAVEEKVKLKRVKATSEPKFRNPDEMTIEELTDPDYRLKLLAKVAGIKPGDMLICSKCHHCRR